MSQGKGDRDRTNRRKFEEGWEYIEKKERSKNVKIERDRRRREKRGGSENSYTS